MNPASQIKKIFSKAIDFHRAGKLQKAQRLYRNVLAIDPDHSDSLNLLGLIAHQVGQNHTAVQFISAAISKKPEVPEYHNNIGEAHRASNNPDEAIVNFKKALKLRPDYPEVYNNMGNALKAGHFRS